MKRRLVALVCSPLLVAGLLAACGRSDESSPSEVAGVGGNMGGDTGTGGVRATGGSAGSGGRAAGSGGRGTVTPSTGGAAASGGAASGGSPPDGAAGMGGDPVQGGAPSVGGGGPIEVDEHPTFDGFDAENILGTSFLLRWSAASDNETPSRELVYDVYLSETAGTPQLYLTTEPGAIQVRLQNLERSTTYYVLVRARDEDNNWSENDAELAVTTTTDVSLKFDIHPIFAVKCATAGCHTGIAAVGNLRLDPGWAWTALVDVVSTSDSTKKRVAPGDLEGSRLYETLTATDSWRMPPVGSLSAEEQSLIADWITQGALNN